jgi:large subunit ribosomal protein L32e
MEQNIKIKKKKFVRYGSINQKKLKKSWRRPRGMHNKVRLKKKGHIHKVSIGYRTKKETRDFYNSKFDYKLVNNLNDLNNIDKKYILISKSIGLRKKIEILKKAKELNLDVLNFKDTDSFLKNVQDKFMKIRKSKEEKQQKKEVFKKKVEEKEKEKKEISPEERAEKEKEDKKKLLESK